MFVLCEHIHWFLVASFAQVFFFFFLVACIHCCISILYKEKKASRNGIVTNAYTVFYSVPRRVDFVTAIDSY